MYTRAESCWHPTEPHIRNVRVKSFQDTLKGVLAPSCREVRQVDALSTTQEDCRLRQALRDRQEAEPFHVTAVPRAWTPPVLMAQLQHTFLAISCLLRTCHSLRQAGQQ